MALDETEFENLATAALRHLAAAIEDALPDQIDVDLQGGILTLELDDGAQYVINKHGPNRQIWLSSPKSGAWHFAWDVSRAAWVSTRTPARLDQLIADELAAVTGIAVTLSPHP